MRKTKVKYRKLIQFKRYMRLLKEDKQTFELQTTRYSRVILHENTKTFFNEHGTNDNRLLGLISKVRSDGKAFLDNPEWNSPQFVDFFNMINLPYASEIISKVDIKGAYWNYALKCGVVSKKTDEYLMQKFEGHSYYFTKQMRLASLGSLATRKKKIQYINGKPDYDTEDFHTQETRDIYMNICYGIDSIMKQCADEVEGCKYYYWDCMFLKKQFEKQAIEFFKDHKYDVGLGETKLEYVNVGEHGYILSHNDGIMYMTRKENQHIIPEYNDNIVYLPKQENEQLIYA